MRPEGADAPQPALSVVIPSYNSAQWLPTTIAALADAVRVASTDVEVIVVDDGSTDATPGVVEALAESFPGTLQLVVQENKGRFLARWEGLARSRADHVLLLDSRVLIHPTAIDYVLREIAADPTRVAWNAFVETDPKAPLVGMFWEVPTHVFWGRFLRAPRPFDLTSATFDSAPKGTTMFLASKPVFEDAFRSAWPEGDAKLVSDDTKVLRRIADVHTIRLDPGFSATYRPRTTVRAFVDHSYDRGTLFVDSYAGTTPARSAVIVTLVVLPAVAIAVLIALVAVGRGAAALKAVAALVVLALSPLIPAAINRCSPRGLLAFVVCLPIFIGPFWRGLVRGIVLHRRAFVRPSSSRAEGEAP
ncbi:hypothetical protein ASD65_17225 [Microbacterium sp. Root61]|uniref:glycosyltransferase family 2 protein n=1 Tax=Microbacterium sp. Root61 TaxID=1736570 RepID=UPI0007022889|nr:glycosyltransferase family A protein [Microbacterium sp. Root61]KRA22243.1 hypothetical protein ASD65_17225 [Microbacterium sp. Root61]